MPRDLIADVTLTTMEKVLDSTAARQRAIAHNIANIDTPGYTRRDVSFHDQLARALEGADEHPLAAASRLAEVEPRTVLDNLSPRRADGNNTDIEREMSSLAQNTLEYEAAAEIVKGKFDMLRAAISEGRK
jgi:flagellar basal-body rod protein FlgB